MARSFKIARQSELAPTMTIVILFFGSGLAFFVGLGFILLSVLLAMMRTSRLLPKLSPLTAILGLLLVGVSATPLPYWYYAAGGILTLGWLVIEHQQASG